MQSELENLDEVHANTAALLSIYTYFRNLCQRFLMEACNILSGAYILYPI